MEQGMVDVEKKQPQVFKSLENLARENARVDELIGKLTEKLAPIIRPPVPSEKGLDLPPTIKVEIAKMIDINAEATSRSANRILDLLDSLEI